MRVGSLIDYLRNFDEDDEIEIEIHETVTGKYIDSTAAIAISENNLTFGPALQIDIEAALLRKFLD